MSKADFENRFSKKKVDCCGEQFSSFTIFASVMITNIETIFYGNLWSDSFNSNFLFSFIPSRLTRVIR